MRSALEAQGDAIAQALTETLTLLVRKAKDGE
jgi:hypothetical protein